MQATISLQMYTLRDLTQTDMLGTLEKVAAFGYQGVELAGLGNSTAESVNAKLRELGLKVTGSHIGIDVLENDDRLEAAIAESQVLGNSYLIVGWLDASRRGSLEKWLQAAKTLETGGRKLQERGLSLCYHNHDFEFGEKYDGQYALDILFSNADPQVLQTELDCYWVQKGGESPVEYLRKYAGRIPLVHIKDMDEQGNFAEVGQGVLDWPSIFSAAESGGTQAFVVEQDVCPGDPLDSIAISIENLRAMGKL